MLGSVDLRRMLDLLEPSPGVCGLLSVLGSVVELTPEHSRLGYYVDSVRVRGPGTFDSIT